MSDSARAEGVRGPGFVIDGKAVAAAVRARVATEVRSFEAETGRTPGLATVIVGDDPASQIYVANKHKACAEAGMRSINHELAAETSQQELEILVSELGDDGEVDGILVQLPIPDHLD